MEMRGRAMDGWLRVDPAVVSEDDDLRHWVEVGVSYAESLPAIMREAIDGLRGSITHMLSVEAYQRHVDHVFRRVFGEA